MMQLGGPRAEARQGRIPTSAGPMPSYRGKFDVCQDSHDSLSSTSEMGEHPGSPSVLRFCFHFFIFYFFPFSPTAALGSLQLGGSLTTSPPVCLRPSNRPSCGLCQLIPPLPSPAMPAPGTNSSSHPSAQASPFKPHPCLSSPTDESSRGSQPATTTASPLHRTLAANAALQPRHQRQRSHARTQRPSRINGDHRTW
ncbi:hypothetical protein BKA80DRAFT_80552 [Phyllosticta citrichinensis]